MANNHIVLESPQIEVIHFEFDEIINITKDLQNLPLTREENKFLREKIILQEKSNQNLRETIKLQEKQLRILKEEVQVLVEFTAIQKETIISYQELFTTQKKIYEEALDLAKPSWLDRIKDSTVAVGAGIVIGLLLL